MLSYLSFYLLIGIRSVRNYGKSWDEQARYEYAKHSLVAYEGKYRDLADEKGPFFGMVSYIGTKVITAVTKVWREIEAWHFMTFLSYLTGLYFFYLISRRLVNPISAFGATLLFSTQPLLWGHAFINPKDIPFMSFFLGSVTLGLAMVDVFNKRSSEITTINGSWKVNTLVSGILNSWKKAQTYQKIVFLGSTLLVILLIVGRNDILEGIARIINQAYSNSGLKLITYFFSQLAQNVSEIPVDAYILKGQIFFTRLWLPVIISLMIIILLMINKIFIEQVNLFFYGGITRQTIFASIFMGFCSSIRVLGLASALLVAFYFLLKSGRKAIPTLVFYFFLGVLTIYLSWPGLWNAPINNYIHALTETSHFSWTNNILFNGIEYSSENIPSSYIPTLLGIQFTEIALILIIIGIVLSFIEIKSHPEKRFDILILGIWFLAPLSQVIIFHTHVYDNFRQLLFIIPPLFVFSSYTYHYISKHLRNRVVYALITLLLIFPGIYWIIKLHPYEYIYYNRLVGGVNGAFRHYEMDYWSTSYKEATEYLNQIAPDGAYILVQGPDQIARTYARSDLVIEEYPRQGEPLTTPDYVLTTSRDNKDIIIYPGLEPIFSITREGAILSVVKQISAINSGAP